MQFRLLSRPCLLLLLTLSLTAACGRGKSASEAASQAAPLPTRSFPQVSGSRLLSGDPLERACFAVEHFWDDYFSDLSGFRTDEQHLGGIPADQLEETYGIFSTLLWNIPPTSSRTAVANLYDLLAASGNAQVQQAFIKWTEHYLYDPNSPVRCEDFYEPFVGKLAGGTMAPEEMKTQYAFQARMCRLNAMGTPATDFSFTDLHGRKRTLYGIRAEFLLLIFGNPDCGACRELTETLSSDPDLSAMIRSGRLQVADIYIDEDIDQWKARADAYPKDWINGYDPFHLIRGDQLYHVRAIPSMYLLDRDKTVLLKDAPDQILISYLLSVR